MTNKELTQKLNELLVGISAYYNADLCGFINTHLGELEIDNTQGEYYTRYDNYTFTIMWKQMRLVSFEAKRKRDEKHGWVVKQVVVEDDFIDYETSKQRIKDRYKQYIARFKEWHVYSTDLETLKSAFAFIKDKTPTLTKEQRLRLISDLARDYWLVDEALESDK